MAYKGRYTPKNPKKYKFHYTLIDHRIRKKSSLEAKAVKNLLKKHDMKLDIILNKEKTGRSSLSYHPIGINH